MAKHGAGGCRLSPAMARIVSLKVGKTTTIHKITGGFHATIKKHAPGNVYATEQVDGAVVVTRTA